LLEKAGNKPNKISDSFAPPSAPDEILKIVMTEKKEQIIQTARPTVRTEDDLRLLPFAVAGLVCFTIAVVLGTGSWLILGSRDRYKITPTAETSLLSNVSEKPEIALKTDAAPTNAEPNPPSPIINEKPLPAGVVEVPGGEIALGGGETKLPIQRAIVKDFSIAETEVTNTEYAEFLKATNHAAPPGWKENEFPAGTEYFPVTNVSYADAIEFCKWLEKKIGLPVRLPSEAEWELAARGSGGNKYPWGNDWRKEAANSKESGGKVAAVKSFPLNRSPFGAFDMAGNVWEWTADRVGKNEEVTDEEVKKALADGQVLRVVKGGSAQTPRAQISAQARYEIPENTRVGSVGFRYVVERRR
jgi:formylglycine-generating enzyme required for sulfatase activity